LLTLWVSVVVFVIWIVTRRDWLFGYANVAILTPGTYTMQRSGERYSQNASREGGEVTSRGISLESLSKSAEHFRRMRDLWSKCPSRYGLSWKFSCDLI
jgi:hypothetical protein